MRALATGINGVWLSLLNALRTKPDYQCAPRGMQINEVLAVTSVVNMEDPILTIPPRKMNYNFMFGEAWWILSGSSKVEPIKSIMKAIARYSDNGYTFRGAYGPKVVDQLDYVTETLLNDEDSRQALLTIWRENPRPSKDIPCTIALQFLIREGELHCVTTMRSSDIWRGWVYDVFNFSMISFWVLLFLKEKCPEKYGQLTLGNLHLTAGSQHLYESDFEDVDRVLAGSPVELANRDGKVQYNNFKNPQALEYVLEKLAKTKNADSGILVGIK